MSTNGPRLVEAGAVAVLGGAVAAAVGAPFGLAVPAAVIGATNGAVSGWRKIYDWSCSNGLVAFTLDSTWGLPMTAAGLFANTVGMVMPNSGYVAEISERNNRHVYRRGFMPRKGFAITLGNVISGADDVERPRRARLVTDHEDVHVWQARWFGPFFPVFYVGWMVTAAGWGALAWVLKYRKHGHKLFATVESAAYFLNPFEWWAYSRDDYWPPSGKISDFGWRGPCCHPLTVVKPDRPSGLAQFRRLPH